MKMLVDINLFFKSIGNGEDKKTFRDRYGAVLVRGGAIHVDLPESKTLAQRGCCWRDWTIVGRILHMSANAVYFKLMKSEECRDIFFQKDDKGNWEFNTLSGFTMARTSELIERYRPVLQNWVDEAHAEHIDIKWSKQEDNEKQGKQQ